MKISHTNFDKLLILNSEEITDNRGSFMKLFNENDFLKNNIDLKVKEYYHSISNKDVISRFHLSSTLIFSSKSFFLKIPLSIN